MDTGRLVLINHDVKNMKNDGLGEDWREITKCEWLKILEIRRKESKGKRRKRNGS
jgi:hypothetical protein